MLVGEFRTIVPDRGRHDSREAGGRSGTHAAKAGRCASVSRQHLWTLWRKAMCALREDPCGEVDASPEIDIVIADDHPVVLAGVEKTVGDCAGCRVVAVAQSVGGMFDALRKIHCDIVISDFSFCGDPGPDGLMMLEKLSRAHPDVRIIVLSQHDDLIK